MRINKPKPIYEKTTFKLKPNSSKNENQNEEKSNYSNANNNKPIQQETPNNTPDLSSPAPSFIFQKNTTKINSNKLYEMLDIEFDKNQFRLFLYINDEDNLIIELIPKDGNIPFSYKNVFDEDKFYKMNKIFMELKTVDKIGEKIISLFKKEKVLLGKNKKEDIFYLILKITIIDEDADIFIPLNKNEDIQLCTINYLLKESEKIKNDFNIYKDETEELLKKQNDEINELKKANSLYLKIIKKIGNEYENENKEENNGNIIMINEDNNKENENYDEEEEELKKIEEIILDEKEEYQEIEKKIDSIEKELNIINSNYKCDINSKYKILNLSINQTKPYTYIYFELTNTGIFPLNNHLDDIFCNIEGINENSVSFYNEQERYILFQEPLLPNQKIIISKKILINNPSINRKYDFLLNIYSLNHGKISEEPIRFNIFIRDNENQSNFISFLKNKKFNSNFNNKKEKIILEYANILDAKDENNLKIVNLNEIKLNKEINIRKFIYDEKSGMALEDKNKNINNIEANKDLNGDNNLDNNLFEINIVINKEDLENLVKKIRNKYKSLNGFTKEKIEEIVCSCLGDYSMICTFIEKMV